MKPITAYVVLILVFHCTEFIWNYVVHRKVDAAAFLVSWPYLLAQALCLSEWLIESSLFPEWKSAWTVPAWFGLAGVGLGQIMRWSALVHARRSFTHQIRTAPSSEHILVTDGPYGLVRHPGYLGWYLWSVSTQILLLNPVSFLLFVGWGYRFLKARIQVEEQLLLHFFGQDFKQYMNRVPSGLPFIP